MRRDKPLFDTTTHYRVVVQGRVDVIWLQNFDCLAEIIVDETRQMEDLTVINVHTDQSGMVGLIRKLHGLGMTIQRLQVI